MGAIGAKVSTRDFPALASAVKQGKGQVEVRVNGKHRKFDVFGEDDGVLVMTAHDRRTDCLTSCAAVQVGGTWQMAPFVVEHNHPKTTKQEKAADQQ